MLLPEAELGQQATAMLMRKIDNPEQKFQPSQVQFGFEPGETLTPAR